MLRHALLASVTSHIFGLLEVAVSVWDSGGWHDVYERSHAGSLISFETEHGVEWERLAYNEKCLSRARRTKQTVVGTHGGLTDVFVPIGSSGPITCVLVTGPVATARPTSAEILDRWRALTGRQGHPVDPEFSHYVASTLSTLVLDTKGLASFKRLAEALAHLMSQDCDANTVYDGEVEALRKELAPARLADRMWEVAQAIVDERTSRAWASPMMSDRLRHAGFAQYPEQVIAGLFVSRAEGADPVDEMLRRDAFQRAMVELSGKVGAAATGRIGGHGITLFSTNKSSPARTRRHLLDVAERARSLARQRYGLLWHVGLGTFPAALPEQYQTALAAAESAVSQGVRVSDASSQKPGADPLALLRRELPTLLSEKPAALPARLEQYFEAVLARWGHRVDLVRVYLEAAFEPIAEAVAGTDAIDEKSFASLRSSLRRTANDATTLGDLLAAYRSAINDIVGGAVAPRAAPRDRSLRRAEAYMRAHYAEPLTLARVAREAGLAPGHFSRLFHQKERVTFQTYLMRLRVERGQQLLAATALDLSHVARLSGLSTAEYFGRIFRRSTGETPIAYRRRVRAAQPA